MASRVRSGGGRVSRKRFGLGVISDTHGLLRPEAVDVLRGSDMIVHAGDVGSPDVLRGLEELAPVVAVRGNNDRGAWADKLSLTEVLELAGASIYVLHDLNELDLDPRAAGFSVVIAGHSHQPKCEERGGVLFFNPGSAGPRRFRLPISVGKIVIDGARVRGRLETLEIHT
jgi:putative phosphoesterase